MNRLGLLCTLSIALLSTQRFAQSAAQTSQASPAAKQSASGSRPEVLILGSYHMANPGHDIYNMKVDDVLAPKRQREIAQFIEVLKKFRPTKVAIESSVGTTKRPRQYSDYLAGKYTLTANEIEQIGFRVAKEMGHNTIYPVDEDGDFPYFRVMDYLKAHDQADKLKQMDADSQKAVKEENDFILNHTVLENFEQVNSDAHVAHDLAWYYKIERAGEPNDYAGPDLIASWYQRNIRIYHNIVSLIDSPDDRILVIYGFGHLGWLRQIAGQDPQVRLRKLADFTAQAPGGRGADPR